MVPQYDVIGTAEYYETQYKTLYNSKIYTGSSKAEAYNYADKTLLDAKMVDWDTLFIPCLMVKN